MADAEAERAAVVAFLRREASGRADAIEGALLWAAACIDQGDHIEPESAGVPGMRAAAAFAEFFKRTGIAGG